VVAGSNPARSIPFSFVDSNIKIFKANANSVDGHYMDNIDY